jgi:hypothetical protein
MVSGRPGGVCEASAVETPNRSHRWWWVVLALAVVAGAGLALVLLGRGESESAADTPCRAVVRAVREADEGRRSAASVLDVVRAQSPLAETAAARDPSDALVAEAIADMRVNMEAGRPWPSILVLYARCG